MPRHSLLVLALGLATSASTAASAAFTSPAWSRPADLAQATANRSTHQQWNVFDDVDVTAAVRVVAPDIANVNPNGTAVVTEPGLTGAFVTGGGNLYSPGGALDITVTLPGYAPATGTSTRFFVQVKTLGGELVRANPLADPTPVYDFAKFTIDDAPVAGLADFAYAELGRVTIAGGFGGQTVEHAFAFTAPAALASHAFRYGDLTSSVSQDVLSIDTFVVVPEPATPLLVGVAAVAARRRVRR